MYVVHYVALFSISSVQNHGCGGQGGGVVPVLWQSNFRKTYNLQTYDLQGRQFLRAYPITAKKHFQAT